MGRKSLNTSVFPNILIVPAAYAIRNALSKCGNNRARAARMLGIGEATLYRKIKKLEIDF